MKNIEVLKAQIEALEKDVLKIKLKTEDLFWNAQYILAIFYHDELPVFLPQRRVRVAIRDNE